MNNRPIGVLDSGVGSYVTIWKEIIELLPSESIIYLADSKNCPYGNRSSREIFELSRRLIKFLVDQNCKLIVIACNTITVSCLEQLRKDFPEIPLIGTVPVVKTASEKSSTKKIGVLSTVRTSKSNYQKKLIQQFASDCEVVSIGTDTLVPLIENGGVEGKEVLEEVMQPFKKAGIDTLALGCSHFPFLKKHMQKILGPEVLILDSGDAIARQVKRVLTQNQSFSHNKNPTHMLYTTGSKKRFGIMVQQTTKSLLKKQIVVRRISL